MYVISRGDTTGGRTTLSRRQPKLSGVGGGGGGEKSERGETSWARLACTVQGDSLGRGQPRQGTVWTGDSLGRGQLGQGTVWAGDSLGRGQFGQGTAWAGDSLGRDSLGWDTTAVFVACLRTPSVNNYMIGTSLM